MTNPLRTAMAGLIAAGALGLAAKALRYSDEASALIGPSARAVVEEVKGADMPADKAVTAAQAAYEAEERLACPGS